MALREVSINGQLRTDDPQTYDAFRLLLLAEAQNRGRRYIHNIS